MQGRRRRLGSLSPGMVAVKLQSEYVWFVNRLLLLATRDKTCLSGLGQCERTENRVMRRKGGLARFLLQVLCVFLSFFVCMEDISVATTLLCTFMASY